MKVSKDSSDYDKVLVVTAEGTGLPTSIVVQFISSDRDTTKFIVSHDDSCVYHEESFLYANSYIRKIKIMVTGTVCEIYDYYEKDFNNDIESVLDEYVKWCIDKCESRYGCSVSDYEKYQADAVIVFKP